MADDVVLQDRRGAVLVLTLNRPEKLNAWTMEMEGQYFGALAAAADDPDVRVIVVTGAGRGFCSGADMNQLQDIQAGGRPQSAVPRPMTFPTTIPKPIIGAINGVAAGLGFVQALLCDVRFAADTTRLTTAFSKRGLVAEHGSSWLLPRLVGPAVALELLYSGRMVDAAEALALGLVNRVCPADSLLDETVAYATDLAENCSPSSFAAMKWQIYRHAQTDLDTALTEANRLMVETFGRPDFKEGVSSFLEKRPPKFEPVAGSTGFSLLP
jgi:enoyl-CoA hydratase/carnithine racemase